MRLIRLAVLVAGCVTVAAAVECDRIEKYTTEWFLDNVRPEYAGALYETALFYSRGMSEHARALSRGDQRAKTIWDIWPCELFNINPDRQNPLRCIHAKPQDQIAFFKNMSRAYARKARRAARVLHSAADYAHPPLDGIWGQVELPELQSGRIDWLEKLHENMSISEVFWKRIQDVVAQLPLLRLDLKKRGDETYGPSCMPEHEYKVFDNLPW